MSNVTRQTLTDDSGTFTSGTVVNASFVNQIYDQIDNQCASGTNAQTPKATTDEVITARGSKASLNARLNVSLNPDGTLINSSGFALTSDITAGIAAQNWVVNDDFRVWCAGTSAAPTRWNLSGVGATIARSTSNTPPVAGVSAAITRVGNDVLLNQVILASTSNAAFTKSKYFSVGCYVYATVANRARLRFNDGVTVVNSSYHTGDGTWQWLTITRQVSASASAYTVGVEVNTGDTTVQVTGYSAILLASAVALPHYIPCPTIERNFSHTMDGATAIQTEKAIIIPMRVGFIRDVAISARGGPTTSDLTVDVNTWDGAAFTTMFSANKPNIVAGAGSNKFDSSQPDTIARQGYRGSVDGIYQVGGAISIDYDSVGSGGAATNVTTVIHATEYSPPQERFQTYSEAI